MNSLMKSVNISTLNCNNFKANFNYVHHLLINDDISYLNELWLKPNEKYLLDHFKDKKINHNKNIYFKSDIEYDYTKGRPFGGQAWFVNKSFKVISNNFLTRHLSYIHIQIKSIEFIIIGVYMPFDNSKKHLESKAEYVLNLSLITTLLNKYGNIHTFIVGDFNADLFRKNHFDLILNDFIADQQLIPIDLINTQKLNFTYSNYNNFNNSKSHSTLNRHSNIKSSIYTAHLDHILYKASTSEKLYLQCNIIDDVANLSDHHCLNLNIECEVNDSNETPIETNNEIEEIKVLNKNINLNDPHILSYYSNSIDNKLRNGATAITKESCIDEVYSNFLQNHHRVVLNDDSISKHST